MSNVIQFPLQRKSTVAAEFTTVLNATDTLVFQADAVQYEDAAIQDLNKEAIEDSAYMVWELDTTAAMGVADGEYPLRYTALDTSADDHADWFEYSIESHDLIRVVDGQFDVASVLHTAKHLMDISGYHGRYIEALTYNPEGGHFELTVGS